MQICVCERVWCRRTWLGLMAVMIRPGSCRAPLSCPLASSWPLFSRFWLFLFFEHEDDGDGDECVYISM